MMKINIRKIRKTDFDEFYRNEISYYRELKADPSFGIGTYGKKVTKNSVRKQFLSLINDQRSGKGITLVAENSKGEIVGIATAHANAWFEAPHIVDLGVSVVKEWRGKGIGSKLLAKLLEIVSKKYEIATAECFSNNKASMALLKKFGFKRWGYGKRFAKRGKIYLDSEFYYVRLQ